MSKPHIHAASSAKKFGGKPEDYLDIHELMDSSKAVVSCNRHRVLTHQSWFISTILPKVFGATRTNSDGRTYSVVDVGEQHILEDFNGFIPTPQDYIQNMEWEDWMNNGKGVPSSSRKLQKAIVKPGFKFSEIGRD